jgi:hypothetical protein
MEARELRIGNWIKDRGAKHWQISAWEGPNKVAAKPIIFSEDKVFGKLIGHPFTEEVDYLQPIEITQDWLVRFGYHKNGFKEIYNGWFNWESGVLEIGGPDSCTQGMMWRAPCNYVHQLQNLYYALTGKELTTIK